MQMKKSMKQIAKVFSGTFAFLLLSMAAMAQNVVTGKVTNTDGTPAAGVTVTIKGTKVATKTGADGVYKLNAPSKTGTLIFTSTEFVKREAPISASSATDISLVKNTQELTGVVVIGYGSVKKKDLTGAVTNVTSKDFNKGAITTPEQLISGKVAGVSVKTNGGAPGSGSEIRIRGGASVSASNDPLIVIDGMPVSSSGITGASNPLALINPNDIESFSVLKDASATAIYGSRASNGVILITTKKGKKGKPKFTFSSQISAATIYKKADVMSADQFTSYVNANAEAAGIDPKTIIGPAKTDWQDQIFHTAIGTDNNLSMSGGIGNMPYRISLGYLYQNGILKTGNLQRTSAGISLTPSLFKDYLKVEINLKAANTNQFVANTGAIGAAIFFNPTEPVYSGSSRFGGYFQYLDGSGKLVQNVGRNPVGILNQNGETGSSNRSLGNIKFDYKVHFLPDLHAVVNLGYDVSHGIKANYTSDSAGSSYQWYTAPDKTLHGGSLTQGEQRNRNLLAEDYLTYGKDIKGINSRIDLVGGYAYQNFWTTDYNFWSTTADGYHSGGAPTFGFNRPENTLISWYGRLNFNIASKYYFTGSFRRDGSSQFAKGNQWGNFPAAAFAWRIKNEGFLKNSNTISELKIRVGYGLTGNRDGDKIGNYASSSYYSLSDAQALYQIGYNSDGSPHFDTLSRPTAFIPKTWEKTATSNIGFDFGFLNNRISGAVDYYYKKTTDLLSDVNLPAGSQYFGTQLTGNVGTLENRGVELTINTQPILQKDLSWDLGFNITYNKNEITEIGLPHNATGTNVTQFNSAQDNAVGYTRAAYYVFQQVYDNSGKPIEGLYVDRNRDGKVNLDDRYHYKGPDANVFMGVNTSVNYKNLTLGTVLRASFGNYGYNKLISNSGTRTNILRGPGSNATKEVLSQNFIGSDPNLALSDYYVQNASFLKMDNLFLAYNVGKVFNSSAVLRLNAGIQNVFTVTKYKGIDPEIAAGVEDNLYPRPRTYSFGLNLDF
jgi:TonB-dependent starch-binding outer membrane protein SusC